MVHKTVRPLILISTRIFCLNSGQVAAKMAYFFQDNDNDSAFGDDESFWAIPMFNSLSEPLAGSKRDADNAILDSSQPAAPAPGLATEIDHRAEHIDPKVLSCRTCVDAGCFGATPDSRPSKRRASALKVGEYHTEGKHGCYANKDSPSNSKWKLANTNLNTSQPFPDTCFEKFCQGCDWETPCTEPCTLPCGETQCSQDDACWDPHCDQRLCADQCVDPECKKTSTGIDDTCFCQKCDAQPCPLGDPNNECHLAHSAPTASGTIYCYDNSPCHFQEGYHGYDSSLAGYETYPCYSESHGTPRHCDGTYDTCLRLAFGHLIIFAFRT